MHENGIINGKYDFLFQILFASKLDTVLGTKNHAWPNSYNTAL